MHLLNKTYKMDESVAANLAFVVRNVDFVDFVAGILKLLVSLPLFRLFRCAPKRCPFPTFSILLQRNNRFVKLGTYRVADSGWGGVPTYPLAAECLWRT